MNPVPPAQITPMMYRRITQTQAAHECVSKAHTPIDCHHHCTMFDTPSATNVDDPDFIYNIFIFSYSINPWCADINPAGSVYQHRSECAAGSGLNTRDLIP